MVKRLIIILSLVLIPSVSFASDAIDLGPGSSSLQGTNPSGLQDTGSSLQNPDQGLQTPATNEQIQQYMQGELDGNNRNSAPEENSQQSLPVALLLLSLFALVFGVWYLYDYYVTRSRREPELAREPEPPVITEAPKKKASSKKPKSKKASKKKSKTN